MPPSVDTRDGRSVSPLHSAQFSPKQSPLSPPKRRPGNRSDHAPAATSREIPEALCILEEIQVAVVQHTRQETMAASSSTSAPPAAAKSAKKKKDTFVTPDGIEFTNESDYKRYMYQTMFSFVGRSRDTLVRKPGDIRGQSHDLCDLKDCEVQLLDNSAQVLADRLQGCKVYIGPCASDVFIRDCVDCTFTIACKQLRVRDCSHCKVFLYCKTRPALETSHHIEFGVFNGAYPRQGSHFRRAGLDPEYNKWDQVHDFNRSDSEIPKPHWSVMSEQQWTTWQISLPDCNIKPENPVPRKSNALWFTQPTSNPLGAKKPGGLSRAGKGIFSKRK